MKRLLLMSMCFILVLGGIGIQGVRAEDQSPYSGDVKGEDNTTELDKSVIETKESKTNAIEDKVLSSITTENIEVSNYYTGYVEMSKSYSSAYDDYKNYGALYQQFTGITTLNYLDFSIVVDGKRVDGYTIEKKIKNNPADEKSFINTAQDFEILVDVIITNKIGESVTIEKVIKAKVVRVEGKVINRKAHATADLIIRYDDNVHDLLFNNSVHFDLKVQLLDGSISNVKALMAQGGVGGSPDGKFSGSEGGAYDLRYIIEDAANPLDYKTDIQGYFIDKDNNIVNHQGAIQIPFEEREMKNFTSTNTEVKLNAKVGTLPDSAVLESTQRTDLNLDSNYVAYDMNVICNNEKIQPVGNVDLSISIPDNLINKNLEIYYMDEEGKLEEVNSTVNGNVISFTTNHFSTYVVMEKIETPVKPIAPTKPIDPVNPNENEKPIENTSPKTSVDSVNTGDTTMTTLYIALVVVSAGILLVLKKKSALR